MTNELHDLSALELSHAYRAKQLTPVEVTRAVLARIPSCEPKLNAMYITEGEGALVQTGSLDMCGLRRWRVADWTANHRASFRRRRR